MTWHARKARLMVPIVAVRDIKEHGKIEVFVREKKSQTKVIGRQQLVS
jgi:hypothetical protein